MIGAVVGAGVDLVEAWLECVVGVLRRVSAPLIQPIVRRTGAPVPAGAPEHRRGASTPQAAVDEAKYWLAPEPAAATPLQIDRETGELPCAYGHDRIVLLLRDPWRLFVYWEVTPTARAQALRAFGAFGQDAESAREVLRIHDVTFVTGDGASGSSDIEVTPGADHWYVNVGRQAGSFCAEIGLRGGAGHFLPLARSNTVTTPRSAPSPDTTVRWTDVRRPGVPVDGPAAPGPPLPTPSHTAERAPGPTDDRTHSTDVHTPRAR